MNRALLPLALTAAFVSLAQPAHAQLGWNHRAPFNSGGTSFFQRIGMSWGLSGPGFTFSSGGFNNAVPTYGGYQPGAGLTGGGSTSLGGGMRLNWFGEFSQGSRSSYTNQTPTLTGLNGYGGYVADASQSPFVIGVIPVVGEQPYYGPANTVEGRLLRGEMWYDDQGQLHFGPPQTPAAPNAPPPAPVVAANNPAPVAPPEAVEDQEPDLHIGAKPEAQAARPAPAASPAPAGASSAESGAESLADLARKKGEEENEGDAVSADYLARGQQAEAAGKLGAAKAYYRLGLKKAAGSLRSELQARLDAVAAKQ